MCAAHLENYERCRLYENKIEIFCYDIMWVGMSEDRLLQWQG